MSGDKTIIRHGGIHKRRQFLETTTTIRLSVDDVFLFFADAENLERITPPELAFEILTPTPIDMKEGTIIDYRLRLFKMPFRWRTRITRWKPNEQFIDEQVHGPYRSWTHLHTFAASGSDTRMTDRVEYEMPLGPAGMLVLPLVRRQLDRIFGYRANAIRRLLG